MAMFFSYIDGAETVLRGSAFIGLTGGPSADFNMALFGEDPDDLAVFDDFVSRVNATGLSALAMISGAALQHLGPAAKAKGLIEAGNAPLMVRSPSVIGALRRRLAARTFAASARGRGAFWRSTSPAAGRRPRIQDPVAAGGLLGCS